MSNLITIHSTTQAVLVYGGGFAVGALASVVLCALDSANRS